MNVYDDRLPVSFWNKIEESKNGCWLWTASKVKGGYGKVTINRKTLIAHRVSYEALVGEIPQGLCLDHLCRIRNCVNPNHLEAVTPKENTNRGIQHNASKTRCAQNHPYDQDNTYVYPNGDRRDCRTCVRNAALRYRQKRPKKV